MKQLFSAAQLILTLKCEQSTRLVSESLDRDLSAVERWAVRLHSISCWSCRRFAQQLRQLRQVMRRLPLGDEGNEQGLSAEAVHRIEDAIRQANPPG